jgi:hypothetical protein
MKKLFFTMILMSLNTASAHDLDIKCTYKSPIRGCTGQPHLDVVGLEIHNNEFSLHTVDEACHARQALIRSGQVTIKHVRAGMLIKLQSEKVRDGQALETSFFRPDNSVFTIFLSEDLSAGTLLKGELNEEVTLQCEPAE